MYQMKCTDSIGGGRIGVSWQVQMPRAEFVSFLRGWCSFIPVQIDIVHASM